MAIDESTPGERSFLAWVEGAGQHESLTDFLTNNVPSKTKRKPGGDGWIWVCKQNVSKRRPTAKSLERGRDLLQALVERLEDIETNTTIPKVKSKTSGPSKKMVKEAAAKQCEDALRDVGEEEWTSGKWMFFEGEEYVDRVFDKVARSIVDGPLSKLQKARCTAIKVATADVQKSADKGGGGGGAGAQQLICVYFENIWNEEHAKEVLECLVKEHGEIPNSAKADLYTMIGLDSNHPSRIRSTLYRPAELYNWDVLREWQSDYRTRVAEQRNASKDNAAKGKRKYGDDGSRQPVAPEEYWPIYKKYVPTADDDSQTESESEEEKPCVSGGSSGVGGDRQEPLSSEKPSSVTIKRTPLLTLRAKRRFL